MFFSQSDAFFSISRLISNAIAEIFGRLCFVNSSIKVQLICFETRTHTQHFDTSKSISSHQYPYQKFYVHEMCDSLGMKITDSKLHTFLLCMFGYTKFAQIGVIAFSTRTCTQFCSIGTESTTVDKHTQQHRNVRFEQLQHHFRKIPLLSTESISFTRQRENVKINVHQTN